MGIAKQRPIVSLEGRRLKAFMGVKETVEIGRICELFEPAECQNDFKPQDMDSIECSPPAHDG